MSEKTKGSKKIKWSLRRDLQNGQEEGSNEVSDNSVEGFACDYMTAIIRYINELRVRDKRVIFQIFRHNQINAHMFLPIYGVTVGEFAIGQVLDPSKKK